MTAVMHHDTLAPAPRHQSVDVTLVAAASVAMATVAAAGLGAIYAHGSTSISAFITVSNYMAMSWAHLVCIFCMSVGLKGTIFCLK